MAAPVPTTEPSAGPLLLLVFIGAGAGGVLRVLVGRLASGLGLDASAASGFPWATLLVNVVGAGAIGVLTPLLVRRAAAGEGLLGIDAGAGQWLLVAGVLGGFTTFSSFSIEVAGLWHAGRPLAAGAYVLLTNAVGLAATFFAVMVAKQ